MSHHTLLNGAPEVKVKLFVEFDELGQMHFQHLRPPVIAPHAQLGLAVLIYTKQSPEFRRALRLALDTVDKEPQAQPTP